MNLQSIIKKTIEHKVDIIKLVVATLLSFYVLYEGWALFETTEVYSILHQKYVLFTFKIVQQSSAILGHQVSLLPGINYVQYFDKTIELKLPFRSYSLFIVGFIFLFTIPFRKWLYAVNTILFVLLFIAFRSASKTIIELIYIDSIHKVLLIGIENAVNIILFAMAYIVINHNIMINKIYQYFKEKFSEQLNSSVLTLIFVLIVIHPIPRTVITYVSESILDGITNLTLQISKICLDLFGYNATVAGKYIYLQDYCVCLERTCLGIGVLTLVLTIIFFTKTKLLNKLVYACIFSILYLIANSIRLAGLIVYLNESYSGGKLGYSKLHNDVSILLYIFAFLGLISYIIWFGGIDFYRKKRNNLHS